jgi:hypothetical protein
VDTEEYKRVEPPAEKRNVMVSAAEETQRQRWREAAKKQEREEWHEEVKAKMRYGVTQNELLLDSG